MITDEKNLGKDVYERIFNGVHIGIAVCDNRAEVLSVNLAFRQVVGTKQGDFYGNSFAEYLCVNDVTEFFELFGELSAGRIPEGNFSICHNCYNHDGLPIWIHITASVMKRDSENGDDLFIVTVEDITEDMNEKEELMNLAKIDQLTGIGNRKFALDNLDRIIARSQRSSKLVAVLFLDLDGFKKVNDTLGHQYGDMLLTKVSERLRRLVRKSDIVARYGGDEFIVIVEEIDRIEDVTSLAIKISEEMSSRFVLNGHNATIGASIGISIYPHCGDGATALIRKADMAMYECKRRGGRAFYYRCGVALEKMNELLENKQREKEKDG